MSSNTQVRTVRPHDTSAGMRQPGDVYDRTREDADTLVAIGVVELVAPKAKPAPKRVAKGK